MNEYELMVILHPRLTADETTAALASIEAQIVAQGGSLLSTDVWGRRRLAYPIEGSMDGTYVLFTLSMPPTGAAPVEAWLLITDPVIRHLLIRGIIPYQGRGQDDDRDRDRDRDDRDDDDRDDDRRDRDRDDDRGDRRDRDDREERAERPAPAAVMDDAEPEAAAPEATASEPAVSDSQVVAQAEADE